MAEIEHVIVVAFENRSFDHLLGYLDHPSPKFDGLIHGGPYTNPGWRGSPPVASSDDAKTVLPVDPDHSHEAVLEQLGLSDRRATQPTNQGFVTSYERKGRGLASTSHAGLIGLIIDLWHKLHPGPTVKNRGPLVMRSQSPDSVPVLSILAREFALCTRWFASVPGETWPNRNFLHAATSGGETNIQPGFYRDPTIFEALEKAGKTWHIYYDDTPQIWAFINLWEPTERHAKWFPFFTFARHAADGTLPNYSFIEPNQRPPFHLMDSGPTQSDASNSQHPGNNLVSNGAYESTPPNQAGDFTRAEELIATIYEALRMNPALFAKSILLITYDEHGGLYDHVPPPTDVPAPAVTIGPLNRLIRSLYRVVARPFNFKMLGVRVPAIVVSPFVEPGTISADVRDHAAVPATLRALFAPSAPPLSARDAWAAPFHTLLSRSQPRSGDLPDLSAHRAAVAPAPPPAPPPSGRIPTHYRPFVKLNGKVRRRLRKSGLPRSQLPLFARRATKIVQVSQAFRQRAETARQSPRSPSNTLPA